MKIIGYRCSDDIDVEFQDEFKYVKTTTYSNFKIGCVKNPYDRTLFGVGYIGVGKYMAKVNGIVTDEYEKWTNCKMYSPETCILTPQRINMLFSNKPNDRGLPNGIRMNSGGRYSARYNNKNLGSKWKKLMRNTQKKKRRRLKR